MPDQAPKPTPTVSAPKAAPPRAARETDALVEAWWNDHFPGSHVAADSRAWNVAHAAKEDLKKRLQALPAKS